MAAIVNITNANGVTGTQNVTVPAVTGGNAIIVSTGIENASANITVSDASNGTYTEHISNPDFTTLDDAAVYAFRNSAAGVTTVTITPDNGSFVYDYVIYEVSGLDNGGTVQSDILTEGSGTSHNLADVAVTGDGFACGVSALGAATTATAGSGWTRRDGAGSNGTYHGSKTGAFAGDPGPFTLAAAAVTVSVIAFFPDATTSIPFFTTIGAKRI